MKGYWKFFLGIFFLFREKVLATLVDIIYSSCSPSSLRPLFFQRLLLGYLCWIGTMITFRSFSLDVVDSSLDFSGPLHLLKQHLFQGPEGKGARRSGWPEPYQAHITIGRFNKRETSSKLQLVSAVLFKIGSILQVFIPIMKSSTWNSNISSLYRWWFQPWRLWNHANGCYQTTSVVP